MLDDRKAAILRAVVKEYIETAQPVASAHVAKVGNLGVSPATVRNEMAVLEREGYLAHPHTSSGRVPTDKGYRFFVDRLRSSSGGLRTSQKQQVQDFFTTAHGELEQMLHDTSGLLSDLTQYAALVVAVLSNGVVEKAAMELTEEVDDARTAAATAHLAAQMTGRPLVGGDFADIPGTGDDALDALVAAAHDALLEHHSGELDQIFVDGASRMAATFDAVETVRQVLTILEEQYVLVTLLREAIGDDRLTVAIGTEHGVQSLAECSLVIAPYEVEGVPAGTIGVLGPTRMNYPQAMAAVAVVSQRLGRRLTEG